MKNSVFLPAALLMIFSFNVNSQLSQQWVARYNGPDNNYDAARAIVTDVSGNVYITGASYSGATKDDYITIKYNPSGTQLWAAIYNGPADSTDYTSSIAIDASGNVYVTGYSIGTGSGYDWATIKYNSSGTQQWVVRYNGPGNEYDWASSIFVDAAYNVYVTGYSLGSGGSQQDYTTIKYDSLGSQIWVSRYNGPLNFNDWAYSIAVDASGNVYITGCGNTDCTTIKYNSSGVQQWIAMFNGPGNGADYGRIIAVDISGNVYVAGRSQVSGTNIDYLAIKYNSSGVQQWLYTYSGGNDDDPSSMVIDNSANMYITGRSFGNGTDYDYLTMKLSSAGSQKWVQRYNGAGNRIDIANSIAVDNQGNTYVTGYSDETGTFNYDAVTIKYTNSGVQQWIQKYNGPGNGRDWAGDIAVNSIGEVFITGYSTGIGSLYDCTTIKYSSNVTGIQPISTEIPNQYSLAQNYPNPFNPTTKIKFAIPIGNGRDRSMIKIYDALGREISTLVNEQLNPGTYKVEWNASAYPSGVYYYKLVAGDFRETKKMILIK